MLRALVVAALGAVCGATTSFSFREFFAAGWTVHFHELAGVDAAPRYDSPARVGHYDMRAEDGGLAGSYWEDGSLEGERVRQAAVSVKFDDDAGNRGTLYLRRSGEEVASALLAFHFASTPFGMHASAGYYDRDVAGDAGTEGASGAPSSYQWAVLSPSAWMLTITTARADGTHEVLRLEAVRPDKMQPTLMSKYGPVAGVVVLLLVNAFMRSRLRQQPARRARARLAADALRAAAAAGSSSPAAAPTSASAEPSTAAAASSAKSAEAKKQD